MEPIFGDSHSEKLAASGSLIPLSLTLEFEELLRLLSHHYGSKDRDAILNKNLTPFTYWMILDAFYFTNQLQSELERLEGLRRRPPQSKNGTFLFTKDNLEDERLLLHLRKLALESKPGQTYSQSKKIESSQLIALLESQAQLQKLKINSQLAYIFTSCDTSKTRQNQALCALGVPIIQAAHLFRYALFQETIIEKFSVECKKKINLPKCELCFHSENTVACKTCSMHIHTLCYPQLSQPINPNLFRCDTCTLQLPQDTTCVLCPCEGGNFFELAEPLFFPNYQLVKNQESGLKYRFERKKEKGRKAYIHLSCFVLNGECTYNSVTLKVQGVHLIDRRRAYNICAICSNSVGITFTCHGVTCRKAFHPECAKRSNLSINVIKANNKALLQIYCDRHKQPRPFERLKESSSGKIKEMKKFFESMDYEIKRLSSHKNPQPPKKPPKVIDESQVFLLDSCTECKQVHDYTSPIFNCQRCYKWTHQSCSKICLACEPQY